MGQQYSQEPMYGRPALELQPRHLDDGPTIEEIVEEKIPISATAIPIRIQSLKFVPDVFQTCILFKKN